MTRSLREHVRVLLPFCVGIAIILVSILVLGIRSGVGPGLGFGSGSGVGPGVWLVHDVARPTLTTDIALETQSPSSPVDAYPVTSQKTIGNPPSHSLLTRPTQTTDFVQEVQSPYLPYDAHVATSQGTISILPSHSVVHDRVRRDQCQCLICNATSEASLVQLYTRAMGDGLGSVALHIIYAAGIAARLGFVFRGALGGDGKALRQHRAQKNYIIDFLFGHDQIEIGAGPAKPEHVFLDRTLPPEGMIQMPWADPYHALNPRSLSLWRNETLPSAKVQAWQQDKFELSEINVDFILPRPFRQKLREQWECAMRYRGTLPNVTAIPWTAASSPTNYARLDVVAHYRRGDAELQPYRSSMMLHRQWYFVVTRHVQLVYPNSTLRAFTSCVSEAQCAEITSTEVPIWKEHGIALTVDNEHGSDPNGDWERTFAQLASADILIMAKSSLSHLAAMFASSCVILSSEDRKHTPLSNWIRLTEPTVPDKYYAVNFDREKRFRSVDWHTFDSTFNESSIFVLGTNSSGTILTEQLRASLNDCLNSSKMAA